jgi:undecaprenyl-diphosphatase
MVFKMSALYSIDKDILFFFNQELRSEFLNSVFVFFSDRKSALYFIPLLILILLVFYKNRTDGRFRKLIIVLGLAAAAVSFADVITARIIKPVFARPRPCQVLEGLCFWKEKAGLWVITDGISSYKSSFSFFSNHAANSMTAALVLGHFYKKLLIVFIAVSVLIGLSRLYLGVHYPSDVLSGWTAGAGYAYVFRYLHGRLSSRYAKLRI